MSAQTYRRIAVGSLPDSDWVVAQDVGSVVNVYTLLEKKGGLEVSCVWLNNGVVMGNVTSVTLRPVERKAVTAANVSGASYTVFVAATTDLTLPALAKRSLEDTRYDDLFLMVSAAVPPGGATHLDLVIEETR